MTVPQRVMRFDRAPIGKAHRDEWGNLVVPATLGKPGVFKYRQPDGSIRRELKHPDELFAKSHLDSIRKSVVTNEHLPGQKAVTPLNQNANAGNIASEVKVVDNELFVDELVVRNPGLIADIESGRKGEISLGLDCWIDHTPGIWRGVNGDEDGVPYDVIQRGMIANQASVTTKARVPGSRLHVDSAEMVTDSTHEDKNDMTTMTLQINGAGVPVEVAAGSVIKTHLDKLDSAISDKDTLIATLTAERDTMKAERDTAVEGLAAQKKLTADAQDIDIPKLVKARNKLMTRASGLLDEKTFLTVADSDDEDVRKACLDAHKVEYEGESADYIRARFDGLQVTVADSNKSSFINGVLGTQNVDPSAPPKQTQEVATLTGQERIKRALTADSACLKNTGGIRVGA